MAGPRRHRIPSPSSQGPASYLIGRRYGPKPYNGRVVLFRRNLRAISKHLDWKLGCGEVIAGKLDVVEIHGGHEGMFNEPGVQRTAATLAVCLRDHRQGETVALARKLARILGASFTLACDRVKMGCTRCRAPRMSRAWALDPLQAIGGQWCLLSS